MNHVRGRLEFHVWKIVVTSLFSSLEHFVRRISGSMLDVPSTVQCADCFEKSSFMQTRDCTLKSS